MKRSRMNNVNFLVITFVECEEAFTFLVERIQFCYYFSEICSLKRGETCNSCKMVDPFLDVEGNLRVKC